MEEVRITTTNGRELSLQGELLARAATQRDGTIPDRWFDLRVYRSAQRGFVPVIEFGSTFENENAVTVAEVVDRSHDIENFFFVFEPIEVISDEVLDSMQTADRQRLLHDLLETYDPLVNRVLIQLQEHCLEDNCTEDATPSKKKGLLGYLGL